MEPREVEERCGGCKCMEEELYWNHLKCIRFCVAFCSEFHQKLQLPKKFADNMRPNSFNPKLTLRGPSGALWEVDLLMSVDGFFLHHGWEEFVIAHSLEENDVLFFEYDRNSTFDVKIFDGKCEKVSAFFVRTCRHMNPAVKNHKKRVVNEVVCDEDTEICSVAKKSRKEAGTRRDGLRHCSRNSTKSLLHRKLVQSAINIVRKRVAERSSMGATQAETEHAKQTEENGQPNKEVAAADQNPPEATENVVAGDPSDKVALPETRLRPEPELVTESPRRKSLCPKIPASPAVEYVSKRRPVTEHEKIQAMVKAARGLNDYSFLSTMQSHNCYKGFYMTIPPRFASTHRELIRNQEVILRVGEKQWTAKFIFGNVRIGIGWKEFALDNYLEESDVCLFTLVSRENTESVVFDVTIFRVVEDVVNPPTLLAVC